MNRKKVVLILLCFVFLAVFSSFASAETLGFGFVNAGDVALRKEPGGQKLIRLQKDDCVWIKGSKTDGSGALWYNVSASYDDGGTARSRSGWMKAEFIDAGEKLWHDVSSVKAADYGMMVLRKDGTVDCVCETGNRDLRSWAAGLRDIRNISLSWLGWSFSALSGSGTFYSEGASETGIRVSPDYGYPYLITTDNRLMTGETTGFTWFWPQNVGTEQLSHVTAMTGNGYRLLLLTDDGRVYAAGSANDEVFYSEPDWEKWTDVAGFDAGIVTFTGARPYHYAFTAVRMDGTVLAAPDQLALQLSAWQDMKKVSIGYNWILGLKKDGTVVAFAPGGTAVPDVSVWAGITDIGNGGDYLVGVKEDGTLVFAGEHRFSD